LQRQQVESVPDLEIQAVLQHDNGIGGIDGNLQVMFPLRTVNRNQGGIQEASAQVIAARQSLERKRLDLRSKLAEVFALYETVVDQTTHYRDAILPKAAENLDLVRHGYEAGEFSFIQVLVVQRTFAEKNSIYLKALGELWMRKLEIEGLLLKDSLSDFE
jgi:outer membrane protein, heavy metal efflux system